MYAGCFRNETRTTGSFGGTEATSGAFGVGAIVLAAGVGSGVAADFAAVLGGVVFLGAGAIVLLLLALPPAALSSSTRCASKKRDLDKAEKKAW
jgi:hypothetical protein